MRRRAGDGARATIGEGWLGRERGRRRGLPPPESRYHEESPAEGSVGKLLLLLLYYEKWETVTTGYPLKCVDAEKLSVLLECTV